MKALKWIGIGIGLLIALIAGFGFLGSSDYALARSIVIDAPPEKIHEYLGDLERWPDWAPFEEDDPSIQTTLGATTKGVGASQEWTGDSGNGWLRITSSDPTTGIVYEMAFVDGETEMPANCRMNYTEESGKTEVTWEMSGDVAIPVVGPYLALFMDGMVGDMFDRGLEKLKKAVENTKVEDGE